MKNAFASTRPHSQRQSKLLNKQPTIMKASNDLDSITSQLETKSEDMPHIRQGRFLLVK